jgi:hypothetical protein
MLIIVIHSFSRNRSSETATDMLGQLHVEPNFFNAVRFQSS